MAVLPIRIFGDPVLRQQARGVSRVGGVHRRLAANMTETMRVAPGVGLAGPQVGVLERIFTWEVDGDHGTVINPVIVARSEAVIEVEEGCLSLPGLAYPVERAAEIKIEGLDELGRPVALEGDGLLARVFQHEIDHLDGVLFVDRLPEPLRREAMGRLTDLSLGLASPGPSVPAEETL